MRSTASSGTTFQVVWQHEDPFDLLLSARHVSLLLFGIYCSNGELPLELYYRSYGSPCIFGNSIDGDVSTSFIDARQNAGRS